ncbi:MAG: class I SAM-dependent methyltransferase [Candidatus Komeilibacteria bacterium]|nr:class I SAM-dependent methyltransferase [Candidatus Komeilibacteria bacterium]
MLNSFLKSLKAKAPLPIKKIRHVLQGVGTYVPQPFLRFFPKHMHQFYGKNVRSKHDIISIARVSYSFWLRHLVALNELGLPTELQSVAEIGPGDSLGIGLAAILTGASKHYAFDIIDRTEQHRRVNLEIFEELIKLFRSKSPIPDNTEFPKAKLLLRNYAFPDFLNEARLAKNLNPGRLAAISEAIIKGKSLTSTEEIEIKYIVSWDIDTKIEKGTVDIIFSDAVMEHVDDIDKIYKASSLWLKRGGFTANVTDFRSHETSSLWNGHWTYSDFLWQIIRGKCVYLINREPHSAHLAKLKKYGFKIIREDIFPRESTLSRYQLAGNFKNLSDQDLTTCSSFVLAQKI